MEPECLDILINELLALESFRHFQYRFSQFRISLSKFLSMLHDFLEVRITFEPRVALFFNKHVTHLLLSPFISFFLHLLHVLRHFLIEVSLVNVGFIIAILLII